MVDDSADDELGLRLPPDLRCPTNDMYGGHRPGNNLYRRFDRMR